MRIDINEQNVMNEYDAQKLQRSSDYNTFSNKPMQ